MAQGKLKVKSKPPPSKKSNQGKSKKGPAAQRRSNAPIQPKKTNVVESNKLKKIVTKGVNKAMEDELREMALNGKQSLTKKDGPATRSSKIKS